MNNAWNGIIISRVALAVYVYPNSGKNVHHNRPFHGFVLNDSDSEKEYIFSDGRIMHTKGGDFFYLPKNSSYCVKNVKAGGCYAINFEADIDDEPFTVHLPNYEKLLKSFKAACNEWKTDSPLRKVAALRALYDGIYQIQDKNRQQYTPSSRQRLIAPAIDFLEQNFTDCNLSIKTLSEQCGISEVYFRKIFSTVFGTSPKEYIIRKRMMHAKRLLASEQFEVSEVGELCGYSEPCHFSREFKKMFGVSPNKYMHSK